MFRTILKRQLATVCASTRARWRGRAIPLSPLLVRRDLTHSRARPGGVAASRFAVYAPHGEPHPLAIISQQTLLSIDRIGVNSPRCGSRSSASDGGQTRVPREDRGPENILDYLGSLHRTGCLGRGPLCFGAPRAKHLCRGDSASPPPPRWRGRTPSLAGPQEDATGDERAKVHPREDRGQGAQARR